MDLSNMNFFSANLSGANLRGAILSLTDLGSADLSGADLSGAKLILADIDSQTILESAIFDDSTTWPFAFEPTTRGAINQDHPEGSTGALPLDSNEGSESPPDGSGWVFQAPGAKTSGTWEFQVPGSTTGGSKPSPPRSLPYSSGGGGATLCTDGTVSGSTGRGTCSYHGGIN